MRKMIVAAVAALMMMGLMTGCGGTPQPTPTQIKQANFGPSPKNIKVSNIIDAFDDFKDPESVKIRLTLLPPRRAFLFPNGSNRPVWVSTVEVNGKNSYGAYVGYSYYYVVMLGNDGVSSISITDSKYLLNFVDKL